MKKVIKTNTDILVCEHADFTSLKDLRLTKYQRWNLYSYQTTKNCLQIYGAIYFKWGKVVARSIEAERAMLRFILCLQYKPIYMYMQIIYAPNYVLYHLVLNGLTVLMFSVCQNLYFKAYFDLQNALIFRFS